MKPNNLYDGLHEYDDVPESVNELLSDHRQNGFYCDDANVYGEVCRCKKQCKMCLSNPDE